MYYFVQCHAHGMYFKKTELKSCSMVSLDIKSLMHMLEDASINLQPFRIENIFVFKLHTTGDSIA